MREREKIQGRLRRKEAEIQGFEEKIRATRAYVQALRDVLKMLDGESNEQPTEAAEVSGVLRPGSAVARAREVILKRGEPVHISELLVAQQKEPTRKNRATLTSSLSAYVRRGEIFTRPAPNTFGLTALDHHKTEEPSEKSKPPAGFGRLAETPKPSSAEEPDEDIPF